MKGFVPNLRLVLYFKSQCLIKSLAFLIRHIDKLQKDVGLMISDLVHPQTFPNLFPAVKRFGKVEDGLFSLLNTLYQILITFFLWELCVYSPCAFCG